MTEETEDSGDGDILSRAKKFSRIAKEAWSEIYEEARCDLEFLSDRPDAQWLDGKLYNDRIATGRPCVSIDQVSQFVHQVVNDIRMNTPSVKCIPHTGGADVETAEILDGLIKDIEYQSGADEAYDTAANFSVKSGIGFILVDHDYAGDDGFDQELRIKRVINPEAVLIDPASVEIDGSDAKYGFIFDPISTADFKAKYPDQEPCSFWDDEAKNREVGDELKEVVLAQFFWIEEERRTLTAPEMGANETEARTREAVKRRVRRARLSGKAVLEDGDDFPGEYIPIVPVYGEEAWECGKRKLLSLIRKAKSPAFMANLWASLETEMLMKQPMAPVMAPEGTVEDYAADWLDPSKAGVLRYRVTDVDGKQVPAPQRLAPPQFPAGFGQAVLANTDRIKASLGMYNASLGQTSNETSGRAINARKVEGDVATYHFGDNLNKSIAQVGRILVSAIPVIYDTPRIVRTFDKEDNPRMVGINGQAVEGQEQPFDFSQGKYSVRVVTGPSFTTQRQEAVQMLGDLIGRQPALAQIAGDILFKNMDFPGAQAVAERLKKSVPPQLREDEDGEKASDPEKLQMQQVIQQGQQAIAELQQQLSAAQQQLDSKQTDLALQARSDSTKAQIELEKLRIEAKKNETDARLKAAEIALKDRELRIKEAELSMRQMEPPSPAGIQ